MLPAAGTTWQDFRMLLITVNIDVCVLSSALIDCDTLMRFIAISLRAQDHFNLACIVELQKPKNLEYTR
jgi:hypothetical protein